MKVSDFKTTSEYIAYIDRADSWVAGKWCEENEILFMSFNVDWHDFNKPYEKCGFCFLDAHDKLLFELRWA